jgi:Uncharacterized protein conserved in bacteria (DUF2272)
VALRFGTIALCCPALLACTPPDVHMPPFAKRPYEPFSRRAVVAITLREWRLFGQEVQAPEPAAPAGPGALPPEFRSRAPLPGRAADPAQPLTAVAARASPASVGIAGHPAGTPETESKAERRPGLWQRIGEYWWMGLDAGAREAAWTGKHDADGRVFAPSADATHAWSAAFVSYVMRVAGAGARFPYAPDHADYINAARQRDRDSVVVAEPPEAYAPVPGDLICRGRGEASSLRFADLPAGRFPAHCDVVVRTAPGWLLVIGGNVEDAVTLRAVPTAEDGRLATAGGGVVDPDNPWMVVLRLAVPDDPGG